MSGSTHLDHLRALARYNRWFNGRLYDCAAELSDAERKRDLGAFFRSLHGTFDHLLLTDRIWLARAERACGPFRALADAPAPPAALTGFDHELYSDFAELRRERDRTDAVIVAWLAELDAAALAKSMRYANSRGIEREHPLWFFFAHFFNHQTHHRGQATTILFQLGRDPGITDLIARWGAPE
jgi:uncharacterized damage-inducible protein DinB